MKTLEIRNLRKWYKQKNTLINFLSKNWIKAVDDIDLTLEKGKVLGIIGESGCGKSTLGRMLIQLEEQTDGEVLLHGESTKKLIKNNKKKFKRDAQIIFQNPFDTFPPKHTIKKIMKRPLELHQIGESEKERYEMCKQSLELGGLIPAESFLERYPHELSGGQLQRISVLRAMLLKPSLLIADEPTSMLDVSVRADILNMLLSLTKENDTSLVFISHDIASARYVSDKIAVMYLGRIVEMGKTDDVIQNPQHPYTQALISNCASIDVNEILEPITIAGEPPTPLNSGPGCYFAERCFKAEKKCFESYPNYREAKENVDHVYSCYF